MAGRFRLRSVPTGDDADPTPEMLMRRVARGDEAAFAALYDELAPLVYGIVLKVVRDPAISQEVTQEIFVEVWKIAARFDEQRGGVRGWTATIAHRRAVDRVRSEEARRRREEDDHAERSPIRSTGDVVADTVTDGLDRSRVTEALAELTQTQREAIELAYFHGKTYREVAVLLDIPEGTAKTRIRDGLIRLRDKIGVNE